MVIVTELKSMNYIILNLLILHIILVCYIISCISFTIYNKFKGRNGKVKLERSTLWQLDNSRREADGGGGSIIQGLFSSYLHFLWGYVGVDDR